MTLENNLNKLVDLSSAGSDRKQANIPDAWRPRLELSESGGFFVSSPKTGANSEDANELLAEFDLSPADWRITSVRKGKWQRYDGEWLESFRVNIVPVSLVETETAQDLEKLIAEIAKWRPGKGSKPNTGSLTNVFAIGDTQYGKDAGDGSEGTVRRVLGSIDESVARHKELVKAGRNIGTVCLPQLGDCIEGSTSQHGKVLGRSDLTVTQQVRLGRRVLMQWMKAFAPLVENIIVPVVPGNHDEPHRVVISNPSDSWQVEVVAAVQDACAENPALAHIQFRYPEHDHGSLAVNLGGTLLGMVHGHQARDLPKWWANQSTGRTAVGEADILLSAHYHHFVAQQVGPRLWLQVPAMDGGSPWFRERAGLESPAGIVSFVVGDGYDPRRDLSVLAGENR
jgi:hypothetical protein